ncbi:MAG: nicotinate-nucleotide adenylyltransferase [Anaerolineae bacterium]
MSDTRLGVLGGTFDPIHYGHLLAAEQARETLGLDRVLFMPAGDPPHKIGRPKSAAHHRRAMVELAIAGDPAFCLSTIDLDRPGPHYSVDMIDQVRRAFDLSAETCFFILGADSLWDLPGWRRPRQLIQQCRLAVLHRPGYEPEVEQLAAALPGLPARLDWVPMPEVGVASSDLRRRARQGLSLRYQTPEAVIAYIRQHRLYG